jgi:hypothetical protein
MQVVTLIAAILGIVFGLIGAVLGILNYLRDKPKVKVRLDVGWHSTDFPNGDPRKKRVLIRITNVGQRPVYITGVEIQVLPDDRFLVRKSIDGQKLVEGDPPWE